MSLGARHLLPRCLAVWCAVTVGAALAALTAGSALADCVASPGSPTLAAALVGLAWCAVLLCAGWWWLTTTVTVLEVVIDVRRGRVRPRPRAGVVRRSILVACGVAAVTVPAVPSIAASDHHSGAVALPYPDRAVAPAHGGPPLAPRSAAPRSHVVVVRAGDSLWTIARRDLGATASDADVSARWHALYLANRSLIGPDPDLIRPGQRLLLPGKDPT